MLNSIAVYYSLLAIHVLTMSYYLYIIVYYWLLARKKNVISYNPNLNCKIFSKRENFNKNDTVGLKNCINDQI